jgi:hypothetical protein
LLEGCALLEDCAFLEGCGFLEGCALPEGPALAAAVPAATLLRVPPLRVPMIPPWPVLLRAKACRSAGVLPQASGATLPAPGGGAGGSRTSRAAPGRVGGEAAGSLGIGCLLISNQRKYPLLTYIPEGIDISGW